MLSRSRSASGNLLAAATLFRCIGSNAFSAAFRSASRISRRSAQLVLVGFRNRPDLGDDRRLAMRLSPTRLGAVEAKAGRRLITPERLGRKPRTRLRRTKPRGL